MAIAKIREKTRNGCFPTVSLIYTDTFPWTSQWKRIWKECSPSKRLICEINLTSGIKLLRSDWETVPMKNLHVHSEYDLPIHRTSWYVYCQRCEKRMIFHVSFEDLKNVFAHVLMDIIFVLYINVAMAGVLNNV